MTACAIADELGESLDSLLGHTPKEMIKAALQQEDGQTAEIIELLLDLPADRQPRRPLVPQNQPCPVP